MRILLPHDHDMDERYVECPPANGTWLVNVGSTYRPLTCPVVGSRGLACPAILSFFVQCVVQCALFAERWSQSCALSACNIFSKTTSSVR